MSAPTTDSASVELFTIPEAAAALRVPEGWLRKKVTAGSVPHTRLGKHVRFTTEHLRQVITVGEVDPATEPVVVAHGLSPRAHRVKPAL